MSSVLITGANRGLGLEFAAEYAADGWQVFAACRSPAEAEQLKDLARKTGDRVSVFAMDVTDMGSIRNAAMQLKDATIDVLINNAGIGGPRGQPAMLTTRPGLTFSTSIPWVPCGYSKHSSVVLLRCSVLRVR